MAYSNSELIAAVQYRWRLSDRAQWLRSWSPCVHGAWLVCSLGEGISCRSSSWWRWDASVWTRRRSGGRAGTSGVTWSAPADCRLMPGWRLLLTGHRYLHGVIYSIQLVYHQVKSIFNHDMFSLTTDGDLRQPAIKLLKASEHSDDSPSTVRTDIKYTDLYNRCCPRLDALLKSEKQGSFPKNHSGNAQFECWRHKDRGVGRGEGALPHHQNFFSMFGP